MSRAAWNHNVHYHDIVLRSIPLGCRRALDVGCGQGLLARQLATRCEKVLAIDLDPESLDRARAASTGTGITYLQGDVMTHPFSQDSFDLVAAIATLHHLPLRPALARFRMLLKPGGVLVLVGLYRLCTLNDYAWAAAGRPMSWMLRCLRGYDEVGARWQEPQETLQEIRAACEALLPGGIFQRHMLFRYSFTWRKP